MPRYVILEHDWNGVHYDLMLEHGETLATWRLELPLQSGIQPALKLPEHRTAYLEYEGKVSVDRGTVRRVAAGEYQLIYILENGWMIELTGSIKGTAILRHEADDRWQLEWPATG